MKPSSTAIHEGAHTTISSYFGNTPTFATIEPGPGYAGITRYDGHSPPRQQAPAAVVIPAVAPKREWPGEQRREGMWRETMRESAICDLAGPVAEAIHLHEDVRDVLDRNRSDRDAARAGIDQYVISPEARAAAFKYVLREAECLVRQQWPIIVALARALELNRKLNAEQIHAVIRESVTSAASGRWGN
jgi:hypothetical protein